jgi:hypothetical protein
MYQVGLVFQAGFVTLWVNESVEIGTCDIAMNAAFSAGMSAAKSAAKCSWSVDARISLWLERVSRFLDIDRAELLEYSAETSVFRTTAFWCSPDQPPPPTSTADTSLLATLDHLRHNEGWRYETPGEMPASDRWVFDRAGIRSVLGVPASLEGVCVGFMVLGAVRDERRWPDELVLRLRVIADILANAVARKPGPLSRRHSPDGTHVAAGSADGHTESARGGPTLLMHLGDEDEFIPTEAQAKIKGALSGKSNVVIYTYVGCKHAFARHKGTHYDAAAAAKANERTWQFLAEHLR